MGINAMDVQLVMRSVHVKQLRCEKMKKVFCIRLLIILYALIVVCAKRFVINILHILLIVQHLSQNIKMKI